MRARFCEEPPHMSNAHPVTVPAYDPRMGAHAGTWGGDACTFSIENGQATMQVGEESFGPRPLGTVLTLARQGAPPEWIVGFGERRGPFVPDDENGLTQDLVRTLMSRGDPAALMRFILDTAPTGRDALTRQQSLLGYYDVMARALGDQPFTDRMRQSLDRLRERYEGFMELFAPQGWVFSETLQREGGYILAIHAEKRGGLTVPPLTRDRWIAERLLKYADLTTLVGRVATFPVREVWRWAFLVADATRAALEGMYGPAAFSYLVVAEGMWGDLTARIGKRSWKSMFSKGGRVGETAVAESLTWSWESLIVAQKIIERQVRGSHDEPVQPAPTSRHGLLHGRVAGAIEAHHAMKAFTVVEGIVEHAQAVRVLLRPDEFVLPPWLTGENPYA